MHTWGVLPDIVDTASLVAPQYPLGVVSCALPVTSQCAGSWLLTIEFRYDNKQSVLTDIFLVGDNVCMLGITTIAADASIGTDTTKFDILTLLTLYVVSDGTAV